MVWVLMKHIFCFDGSSRFTPSNVALAYRLGLTQNLQIASLAKRRQKALYHEKPLSFRCVPPKLINLTSEHIWMKIS